MLDELERLEREATKAPWYRREQYRETGTVSDLELASTGSNVTTADIQLVCAARNALPALLRLARAAVEWREDTRHDGLRGPVVIALADAIDALVKR